MSELVKRVVAQVCALLLALALFNLIITQVLTLRGEDSALYISAPPSLGAIMVLGIICWFLRDQFGDAEQRSVRTKSA